MYGVSIQERATTLTDNTDRPWGGESLLLNLNGTEWLYVGVPFVEHLHSVTGAFLAKKALERKVN